jgi:HlyD family secretion protein
MASPSKSSRTIRIVLWGAALAVILLAFYVIHVLSLERIRVVAAQVTYQDLVMTSHTNGKVEPLDDFEVHATVAGQVQEIYVNVGDKVKAGDLLLKMDDADALARLASANSALRAAELAVSDIEHGGTQDERNTYAADEERAKLQLEQDATALAALQQLEQKGAASPAEINAATVRLHSDEDALHSIEQHSTQRYGEADRARAQAELADARAAVTAAERAYASVDIRTPISGTVYYLPVSEYDYATSGDDLVYVGDLKHMRITAYFDEPEIGNLAVGQPVSITWEAKPGTTWHGHISQVPTTIVNYQATRNVGECMIDVDDAEGVLQPNANVLITVTTAHHPHVLSIPRTALPPDGSNYVYRIVHNQLVRTPVKTGIINLTQVEITDGLSEGDTVALSATANRELSNGLEVTPLYQ